MEYPDECPLVFDYLNAREFLRDFLAWAKLRKPGFTHRALLDKLGVSSTGFLANVVSGKSHLNPKQARDLAEIFALAPAESRFFQTLVGFTQARGIEEKGDALDSMRMQVRGRNKKLDPRQYSLFSKWIYPLIFELTALLPVGDNYKEVAGLFDPPVKPEDVRKALETLESLALIGKNESGLFRQSHTTLKTGDEIVSTDVVKYQRTILGKAIDALDKVAASERSISATTLPLSPEGLAKAKQEAQAFRDKLLRISDEDRGRDRVYLLNVNLFPGSRRVRKGKA